MRLRDRWVARKRLLVCGNRLVQIARFREFQSTLQARLRIVAQRGDASQNGILNRRPSRAVLLVALQRPLCLVTASQRAVREGERVVRRTPLGK